MQWRHLSFVVISAAVCKSFDQGREKKTEGRFISDFLSDLIRIRITYMWLKWLSALICKAIPRSRLSTSVKIGSVFFHCLARKFWRIEQMSDPPFFYIVHIQVRELQDLWFLNWVFWPSLINCVLQSLTICLTMIGSGNSEKFLSWVPNCVTVEKRYSNVKSKNVCFELGVHSAFNSH